MEDQLPADDVYHAGGSGSSAGRPHLRPEPVQHRLSSVAYLYTDRHLCRDEFYTVHAADWHRPCDTHGAGCCGLSLVDCSVINGLHLDDAK